MSRGVLDALSTANAQELSVIVEQIGVIPEKYDHDSTHEKLYAKMSDCVVSHIFVQLGFQTKVLTERADSADVVGKSVFHAYEFVADAKVFRLSRTAKNQKDFKVTSMNNWRNGADHAVIVCPFYQYPSTNSQIYAQVLDTGVALGSFEHLLFCLQKGIKESQTASLRGLFSYPSVLSKIIPHSERKSAYHVMNALDVVVATICGTSADEVVDFRGLLAKTVLSPRAEDEIAFWQSEIQKIAKMTREEAQAALIESRKIRSKIDCIKGYVIHQR